MIYLDTSVLVPLFVPEPTTARVERWFAAHAREAFGISDWTLTEFASALGIKVRNGELSRETARLAQGLLQARAADSFDVFHCAPDDFALANEMLGNCAHDLRAGDALHLAVARRHVATSVVSLDPTFVAAGRQLALPTTRLT